MAAAFSNQDGSDIVDVGTGWADTNEVAYPGKEAVAAMCGKAGSRINIRGAGTCKRVRRYDRERANWCMPGDDVLTLKFGGQ